ncbi:unnamed protein product [Lathyrus oleraceus]
MFRFDSLGLPDIPSSPLSYDSVVNMRSNEDKKRLKITLSGFVLKVTSMLGCMAFRWNSKIFRDATCLK